MDSDGNAPGRLSRSRGRSVRRSLDFDDTKYAIGGNKYTSDEIETNLYNRPVDHSCGEQYEISDDERDRNCGYENQDDDECIKQLNNQDKYKYVNTQRRPLYFEKVPDTKLTLNPETNQQPEPEFLDNGFCSKQCDIPVVFDSNEVDGCFYEDTTQDNIKMSYRELSRVHDTCNDVHNQHRSFGIQDTRSTNCLRCTHFKHNANHTCCAAPGRVEGTEFKYSDKAVVKGNPASRKEQTEQNSFVFNNVQVRRAEDVLDNRKKLPPGKGREYQMYQIKMRCEEDQKNLRRSQEERREPPHDCNIKQSRMRRDRQNVYRNHNSNEHQMLAERNREKCLGESEYEHKDPRDRFNTAMLESRTQSRSGQSEYDFLDPRNVRTPHSNVSEGLLEQQMHLMNEMFQIMSAQHEQLRSRTNNRQTLKAKPEKFSGSVRTSFHSFIAQFENCSEINQWNEQEKVLMLRSSITGNALSILWDFGSDKDYSYGELVDILKARYGLKGQTETYRLQSRTRKQSRGESLSNLMQDIRKLMALAYPGKTSELIEEIARDAFVEALYDRNIVLQVLTREPKSLNEAFQIATKLQSYGELVFHADNRKNVRNSESLKFREEKKSLNIYKKMQEMKETKEPDKPSINPHEFRRMQDMMAKLSRKIDEMNVRMGRRDSGGRSNKEEQGSSAPKKIVCYSSGKEGHRRFECPDRNNEMSKPRGGKTSSNSSRHRQWNNREVTREDESEEPKTEPKHVNSAGEGSLYVNLRINGSVRRCLLDCGSEVSIIPVRMTEGLRRRESTRVLLAANKTPISMLGEVVVDIRVVGRVLPTTLLRSDQIDSIILGLNWLSKRSCRIDFESDILQIEDKQVQLYRSVQRDFCRRIMTAHDVEIPPNSEKDVVGRMIYPSLKFHKNFWVTENKGNVPLQLNVAHTLIKDNAGEMKIRVMNITKSPIKLQAGRDLCSASLATDVIEFNKSSPAGIQTNTVVEEENAIQQLMGNVDPAIPPETKKRLREILQKHIKAISLNEDDLGRTSLARHHIDTGSAPPVRQGTRRIPQAHAQAVDSQLESMIRQKLIRPSKSDFTSNVVLVKKKDDTWRFCFDYRKVNDITREDAYPLPRIDECLDTLTGSAWFTTIDLRSGYFQAEISEEDAHKTAFITRRGLYEFQVMPQGMCNSAATFQRLMNLVLAGLNYEICLVYIDDIIIFSKDLNEHLNRLEVVLQRLEEAGLKIRPDKCKMLQREVHFLGHVISGEGIRTSPSKTEVVATWPVPTKVTELRSFIGLCSYYRRFIKDFAKTAKPLHALTAKYARFQWTPECQAAFEELKNKMITASVIAFPRDDDIYILDCDASLKSIGAVLSQIQDGVERVISYASCLYSKTESNYCVTKRELLAVVYFCKYYKQYLLGRNFIVRTDHSALTWLRKTPEPIGQQSRWLEQLEEFLFTVEHRSGNKHTNADAMPRRPCRQCSMIDNEDDANKAEVTSINTIVTALAVDEVDIWANEILAKSQKEDLQLKEFYKLKEEFGDKKPALESIVGKDETCKTLWNQWDRIYLQDAVLYRAPLQINDHEESGKQILVPMKLRNTLMEMTHTGMTGGHLEFEKTKEQVRRRAYWPGFSKDVFRFCCECEECARYKRGPAPKQGQLEPMTTGNVMERLSIDITGPHPINSAGHKFLLTVVDHFSKWAEAFPIRNQEASTIAKLLVDRVFCYFGMPIQILSDRGKNFESELFAELCRCLGIEKIKTTIYKPSTNGVVERFHRTLNSMIGKIIPDIHRNWHDLIPQILAAYRASEHSATGYSPNKLILGRECRAPIDLVGLR